MQAPPQPLIVIPKHLRSRACQGRRAVRQSGAGVPVRRSRAGDALIVVTAPPPVRGFIKRQDFVELVAAGIRPRHRDPSELRRRRRRGRARQDHPRQARRPDAVARRHLRRARANRGAADFRRRGVAQEPAGGFIAREDALISAAAAAEPDGVRRRGSIWPASICRAAMYPEAKGVLDLALAEAKPGLEDPVALIVHAVASILMGRPEQGLKDLANPAIGNKYDSQLWKALAYARQGKWAEAREKFKNVEFAIASLPIDLQRIVTDGGDARVDRGQGLFGRGETRQRSPNHRRARRAEAGGRGVARPARRSARPRARTRSTTTRSRSTRQIAPRRPKPSCSRSR